MTIELDNDMRRALGLAVQALEDMPNWLRPESNMDDMRGLLDGKSSGRDGIILAQAVAIALCHRTLAIIETPPSTAANSEVHSRRFEEFRDLFAIAKRIDPFLFAVDYVGMCDRLARSRKEAPPK